MRVLDGVAMRALRLIDPETAHGLVLTALKMGLGTRPVQAADTLLATRLAGIPLSNPIGVAAGFDKDAVAVQALSGMGFGFVECGTTTPLAQAGNPKPRLFRLAKDGAVINRMGFNNGGVDVFAAALERCSGGVVGANIGANKESTDRVGDYERCLARLWGRADYFTLNISSPNTPGLRALQSAGALDDMLARVAARRKALKTTGGDAPIFLKVAPDLTDRDVVDITQAAVRHGLQGLVVANTTLARPETLVGQARTQAGGLSGAPLMEPSTRLLSQFFEAAAGRLALVGVGGVASGADAYAKIRAGADAVQLYTALAYAGPGLLGDILRDLSARLRADGFTSVAQAVGAR